MIQNALPTSDRFQLRSNTVGMVASKVRTLSFLSPSSTIWKLPRMLPAECQLLRHFGHLQGAELFISNEMAVFSASYVLPDGVDKSVAL